MRSLNIMAALAILTSCASGYEPAKYDGKPTKHSCDLQGLLLCGDACSATATDRLNCGTCGHACVQTGSDACVQGLCRCRTDAECDAPLQCKVGVCLRQDPDGHTCSTDAECGIGFACVEARCTGTPCLPEVCDGFDNDCDGRTDEPEKTTRACYTGPKGTSGVSICHDGVQYCPNGVYTPCLGETTPMPESGLKRCDGVDDDCDGCTDGFGQETAGCSPAATGGFDFIFLIDNSGSMNSYLMAVRDTAARVVKKYAGDPRFRFGIMNVTSRETATHLKVIQPLGDFTSFITALGTLTGDDNGTEPTYDAVYLTARGDFDAEFGFTPGSFRVYILIADEDAKTISVPPVTEASMCAEVVSHDILLTVLTRSAHFSDWDACAAGRLFELSWDPILMAASVESTLTLTCNP